ncbi:M28 family peptidase [Portibacter lacus]|uniref:M28 family peptidase n=1 Tax=Portibacter lacus TaxID=1099794 RepID=UPI001F384BA0|nr:M28 family peptidase [Portibacter lacus]
MITLLSLASCIGTKQNTNETEGIERTTKPLSEFSAENINAAQSLEETTEIISALASDEFGGRKPLTDGFKKAGEYVELYLKNNKISPYRNQSYKDSVDLDGSITNNVVGVIRNDSESNDYVMICAHLDHLGAAKGDDKVYNGANDNASGVTAVLQVAKVLAQYDFNQNIIVALFTAEESGLVGSKQLATKLKAENNNLTHVFNFEMIGKTLTTGSNQVYITGFNKSNLAEEMNKAVGFEFVKFLPTAVKYQLFSRSDNFPFYAEFNIPSQTISTFDFENYNYYHKAGDEVELMDLENMNDIIHTSTLAIGKILQDNQVKLNEK